VKAAGSDISHWFDGSTGEPKLKLDEESKISIADCPEGR